LYVIKSAMNASVINAKKHEKAISISVNVKFSVGAKLNT
jgi:hypothetical protein